MKSAREQKPITRIVILIGFLLVAAFLSAIGAGTKFRPGGTAITLTGDVLPCLIMIKVFYTDWIHLKSGPLWSRLVTSGLFLIFTAITAWRISDAYAFHYNPFSRGHLFGL